MIFKYPNGQPLKFFFLNKGMTEAMRSASMPWHGLSKLSVYHDKITYGEMAGIIRYQQQAHAALGVPFDKELHNHYTKESDYHFGMLLEVFNKLSSELLPTPQKASRYQCLLSGDVVLIVCLDKDDTNEPGFDTLEGTTLSSALLETIYKKAGYIEVHNGGVVFPKPGEFTLAEVFKLLSVENA